MNHKAKEISFKLLTEDFKGLSPHEIISYLSWINAAILSSVSDNPTDSNCKLFQEISLVL